MGMEKKPEQPPPDGIIREIFDASLAQNSQISVNKKMRERLGLEQGDRLFIQILKVISPTGETKYEWKSGEVVQERVSEEGD